MTIPREALPLWAEGMAPSLIKGPYCSESRAVISASLVLDKSDYADMLRTIASFNILQGVYHLGSELEIEPSSFYQKLLTGQARFISVAWQARSPVLYLTPNSLESSSDERTGRHYGNLFSAFDAYRYYEEPASLLRQRLERNGYVLSHLSGARCLDSGCGNGRYTVALSKLGAGEVWGLDFSEINITDARKRAQEAGLQNVHYQLGNVLKVPFPDNHFDFVFSNGVLHHTSDPQQGLNELLRVLKPGGIGFYYVIPNPGGIHWDSIELCRVLMRDVDHGFARTTYQMLGVPSNMRFYFLDHVLVPINIRYTREQCDLMLRRAGASSIRRLERGADIDRTERISRRELYADLKYGDGEQRYYFEKK